MFAALYQLLRPLEWWVGASFVGRVGWLAITIGAGAGTYLLTLVLIGGRLSQLRLRAD
jgi:putative peptidoglycan lipid II flippase